MEKRGTHRDRRREGVRNAVGYLPLPGGTVRKHETLNSRIKDGRTNKNTIHKILKKVILGDYKNFEKDFENWGLTERYTFL